MRTQEQDTRGGLRTIVGTGAPNVATSGPGYMIVPVSAGTCTIRFTPPLRSLQSFVINPNAGNYAAVANSLAVDSVSITVFITNTLTATNGAFQFIAIGLTR